jgi:5-methylcytosine-specific restriction endonuclease McrA
MPSVMESIVLEDIRRQAQYAVHYSKKYLESLKNLASEREVKNLKKERQQEEKMRKNNKFILVMRRSAVRIRPLAPQEKWLTYAG